MRSIHHMPFGAQPCQDGRIRFQLWAPAARRVEVCILAPDGESRLSMTSAEHGWFGLLTGRAQVGSRYRYLIDDELAVPDPASRFQPEDVAGPSEVIDPRAFDWQDHDWRGRRWEEAVFYELHVGAFSGEGSYAAVIERLDDLVELGITAIELMPLGDFPGTRNWGYDGVLPFAPDSSYGRPEQLKSLVQAAHARGLMVFLDVVYNHFGPEGNYLHRYAPNFFSDSHQTPWGAAINFDGAGSDQVRAFYLHNALYWIEEYHLDGLRFDAVHAILDDSRPDILEELAETIRDRCGLQRRVHLVLENDDNQARYLSRRADGTSCQYDAQWNDDVHHAMHVLTTGENSGYYHDYADRPLHHLGRALAEGFAWQGEASAYRDGALRGEPSAGLPPTAFVNFLQNHDQVGNRAFGERFAALASPEARRATSAILLLAPAPPLLFMGEEWGSEQPFLFFCDFESPLAERITEGRRREFAAFPPFADVEAQAVPDPCAASSFAMSRLDWSRAAGPEGSRWREWYRRLLALRHDEIIPRLAGAAGGSAEFEVYDNAVLRVAWRLGGDSRLTLLANPGAGPAEHPGQPPGRCLLRLPENGGDSLPQRQLAPWGVIWSLEETAG